MNIATEEKKVARVGLSNDERRKVDNWIADNNRRQRRARLVMYLFLIVIAVGLCTAIFGLTEYLPDYIATLRTTLGI